MTNKCTIISQIITLLHVSTLSCHPQTACNQYLANLHQYFNTCTVQLLLFCTMTNKCTIISQMITLLRVSTLSCHPQTACNQYLAKLHQYFNTCTVHLLLFCTMTNKCTIISQIISHCYMFRHYCVILRQPVINTLPRYTSISIPVPCVFYCFVLSPTNAQLFHKLYHTATCFDTTVSSSDSL